MSADQDTFEALAADLSIPGAEAGLADDARDLLAQSARLLRAGRPLPPRAARFLADRLEAVARAPDVYGAPLLRRTAAEARRDAADYFEWVRETHAAWLAINQASHGQKTAERENAAERLGIEVRELERRFRALSLRKRKPKTPAD